MKLSNFTLNLLNHTRCSDVKFPAIFQVDSAEKLGYIVTGKHSGPRLDSSCVIVHQPWATDQCVLSKSEQQLVGFCHKQLDESPQPVIKLPAL